MNLDERVMELESRLTFQDDTIQALNDVLVAQRRELDQLQLQMTAMLKPQEELAISSKPSRKMRHHLITDKHKKTAASHGGRGFLSPLEISGEAELR